MLSNLLLLRKKKYVANKFEGSPENGKLAAQGIEMVRRDNAPFVQMMQKEFLEHLCMSNDLPAALDVVRDWIGKLTSGKIKYEDLIISKKIAKSKYAGNPPIHVQLWKKMEKRDAASAPHIGDRVPYIVRSGTGDVSARGEDPEYARIHNIMIDTTYYCTSAMKAMGRLLEPVIGKDETRLLFQQARKGPMDAFMTKVAGKRKADYHAKEVKPPMKQTRLDLFIKKK